ncbi:MAG: hypothetical protein JNL51_17215, partial [Chitinophagaceae bacterium]|nr:hypothetical protein [Chitinophagaceae bacterium]
MKTIISSIINRRGRKQDPGVWARIFTRPVCKISGLSFLRSEVSVHKLLFRAKRVAYVYVFPSLVSVRANRGKRSIISAIGAGMAKSWIGVIAGIALFAGSGKAQDCEALIRYRDVELNRQY